MRHASDRSVILAATYRGAPSSAELEQLSASGKRPRRDYVEVARLIDADVIDYEYMVERAGRAARALGRTALPAGQVAEAFLRRHRYRHIAAWAELHGLPLALLHKLTRSRRDLVLVSVWLSRWKKAVFVRDLKVHTHIKAIVNYGSVQMRIAAERLGVPEEKLYLAKQPVDDLFWRPDELPTENLICAIGWEARDYATLVKAVSGVDVSAQIAVGIAAFASDGASPWGSGGDGRRRRARLSPQMRRLKRTFTYRLYEQWMQQVAEEGLPENVHISHQLAPTELRSLYTRSRFVIIPLHDVDADCGVTALTEAMAMGKAVVITRTKGQVDILRDGEQGMYVPPGDASALRRAIEYLLEHPQEAERMGAAGRQLIEREHRLDDYVKNLADIIRQTPNASE